MGSVKQFLEEWYNPKEYIEARTSGSTGKPKTIRLLKSDMRVSAQATNKFFGIDSGSCLALPLSTDYIAGKMMVVRAQEASCELLELPVSNSFVIDKPVDLISVVPSQLKSLLADGVSLKHIDNLLIGGAPLQSTQEKDIVAAGVTAWLSYGMTETCSHVALRRVGKEPYFTALPGIDFETDARGCLTIISDNFSWKKINTNDVVRLISSKEFVWKGRADNVVNSGGVKLHPEELEHQYRAAIPSLPPFYLVGEKDEKFGERLVMVIEKPSKNTYELLKEHFPNHIFLPKRIIAVNQIPSAANGKIRRIGPSELAEFTDFS